MTFSSDSLIEEAINRTKLDDFGGQAWRPGFEKLLWSLNLRPFPADKKRLIEESLITGLSARLKIEGWIASHPELLDHPVEKPLVIMGLPRTGSTALQNNLAADPIWRCLRGWESQMPVPPPILAEELQDPRFLKEKAFIETNMTFKGVDIHEPNGPVEDSFLQRLNWGGPEQGLPAYEYSEWWRDLNPRETLKYQARAMQLLQSERPPHKWMLKSPWYVFYLDSLIEVFPDVRLVMTHRHPAKIIPSLCSLLYICYCQYLPEHDVDQHLIGRIGLEHWRVGISRALAFRRANPDVDIHDVHQDAFNADPVGVLRNLYAWSGEDLSASAEASMQAWAERNRHGTHGGHHYTFEEFGLSEDEINQVFREYITDYCT